MFNKTYLTKTWVSNAKIDRWSWFLGDFSSLIIALCKFFSLLPQDCLWGKTYHSSRSVAVFQTKTSQRSKLCYYCPPVRGESCRRHLPFRFRPQHIDRFCTNGGHVQEARACVARWPRRGKSSQVQPAGFSLDWGILLLGRVGGERSDALSLSNCRTDPTGKLTVGSLGASNPLAFKPPPTGPDLLGLLKPNWGNFIDVHFLRL